MDHIRSDGPLPEINPTGVNDETPSRVLDWTLPHCESSGEGGEGRETGKLDYDSSGSVVGNWLFSYLNYVGTGKCYWGQGVGD